MPEAQERGWAWRPWLARLNRRLWGEGGSWGGAGPGYPGPSVLATEVRWGGLQVPGGGVRNVSV